MMHNHQEHKSMMHTLWPSINSKCSSLLANQKGAPYFLANSINISMSNYILNLYDLWGTPSECTLWWIKAINFYSCAESTCDPATKTFGTHIFCCKCKYLKDLCSLTPEPPCDLYPGCSLCHQNSVDLQTERVKQYHAAMTNCCHYLWKPLQWLMVLDCQ